MENCKNCGAFVEDKYCSNCSQKVYSDKDRSVKHLFEEAVHFVTHFEGKFFTTFKTVFRHPGKLSSDYCGGVRQRYYKPISFFLLIVILYLIFPLFSGMNMEMKYYKNLRMSGSRIADQIERKAAAKGITEEALAEKFAEKSKSTSKILLLLLIPFSIPLIYLLFPLRKLWLFDSTILATEINTFYLLVFYLIAPVIIYAVFFVAGPLFGESTISSIFAAAFVIYLTILFRRFFSERWWASGLKAFAFAFLHTLMITEVYKFIVFEVTFALV